MIVVAAHAAKPAELFAAIAPVAARPYSGESFTTVWGAVAVADGPWWRTDRWLVAGRPQADPWGVPGEDLSGMAVAAELDRYGPPAVQMTTGPFVAVDLSTGAILRALNGLVPASVCVMPRWIASTSRRVVTALSASPVSAVESVAAGSLATPDGATQSACGETVGESVPGMTWPRVHAEVHSRLAPLGDLRPLRLPLATDGADPLRYGQVCSTSIARRAVFVPRLSPAGGIGAAAQHFLMRESGVSDLWWRCRLIDTWLCAPAFERPALDLFGFVSGTTTTMTAPDA